MDLFGQQVSRYTEKYTQLKASLKNKDFKTLYSKCGIENIKAALSGNTVEFKKGTYKICAVMMPGNVSPATYAAVVAAVCESENIAYKVYTGTCLDKTLPKYNEEVKYFTDKKREGIEHPLMATSVYVEADGNTYEFMNGKFDEIDHIDCVELKEC